MKFQRKLILEHRDIERMIQCSYRADEAGLLLASDSTGNLCYQESITQVTTVTRTILLILALKICLAYCCSTRRNWGQAHVQYIHICVCLYIL